jgi:hypothetical protein
LFIESQAVLQGVQEGGHGEQIKKKVEKGRRKTAPAAWPEWGD